MGREITEDVVNEVMLQELPLLALNHVSYVCKSVIKSVQFYEQVLGFVLVKGLLPSTSKELGTRYIALVVQPWDRYPFAASRGFARKEGENQSKDNHISFQCSDMELLIHQLEEMKIEYVKAVVREGGIVVDQIFFHDPDGYMIEICNCQNLPLLPLPSSSSCTKNLTQTSSFYGKNQCSGEVESLMMENLAMDMMNLCI